MVKQMLLNLLSNAVTYTPDGGGVIATAGTTPDRQVAITIRDTGIGIAGADLNRIMEPFQIVENPQSRSYQGIGLGLPLARSLIQLHGGSLTLHSEIGTGTTATLTFSGGAYGLKPFTKPWRQPRRLAILYRQEIDHVRESPHAREVQVR